MKRTDPRLAVYGATMIVGGVIAALLIDAPALRFLVSVSAIAAGFGLIRQAFRLE